MDFIKSAAQKEIPLHLAHKAVKTLTTPTPDEPNAWKFETFIFDILHYAIKIKTLVYPREICFSPLKNRQGPNSINSVQEALQQRDRVIFEQISGQKAPDHPFELSQSFYYPTEELIAKWKDKPIAEQSYIE
jgi:UDP-N-acetylglucosamine/UDP-N-acetylgalactosamine diphosphorylase